MFCLKWYTDKYHDEQGNVKKFCMWNRTSYCWICARQQQEEIEFELEEHFQSIFENAEDASLSDMVVDTEFFASPEMPGFSDMRKEHTHFPDLDVLALRLSFNDKDGNIQVANVFLGTEQNIRRMFEDIGLPDEQIDAEIAQNAEKVHALGLDSLMVENVLDAYSDFRSGKTAGKDQGSPVNAPVLALADTSVSEIMGEDEEQEGSKGEPGGDFDLDDYDLDNEEDLEDEGSRGSRGDDAPDIDPDIDDELGLGD